jgi:hypothetical protein
MLQAWRSIDRGVQWQLVHDGVSTLDEQRTPIMADLVVCIADAPSLKDVVLIVTDH